LSCRLCSCLIAGERTASCWHAIEPIHTADAEVQLSFIPSLTPRHDVNDTTKDSNRPTIVRMIYGTIWSMVRVE